MCVLSEDKTENAKDNFHKMKEKHSRMFYCKMTVCGIFLLRPKKNLHEKYAEIKREKENYYNFLEIPIHLQLQITVCMVQHPIS